MDLTFVHGPLSRLRQELLFYFLSCNSEEASLPVARSEGAIRKLIALVDGLMLTVGAFQLVSTRREVRL
jgi:hypothetical protein